MMRLCLLLVLLGGTSCGPDRPIVVVQIAGMTDSITQLAASAVFDTGSDRRTLMERDLVMPTAPFGIDLHAGDRGTLTVTVDGLGQGPCSQAHGEGALSIDNDGRHDLTIPLVAVAAAQQTCRLTIQLVGDGQGTVQSDLKDGQGQPRVKCQDRTCKVMLPPGRVSLSGQPQAGTYFGGWARTCAAPDDEHRTCPIAVGTQETVKAIFAKQICSPDGLCWEKNLPQGNDLNRVFAISPKDIYAVGNAGMILHYDGDYWARVPLEASFPAGVTTWTDVDLKGVWGNSHGVWVVGGDQIGVVLFRAPGDSMFRRQTVPSSHGLLSIWGASEKAIWAVGYGAILFFDGASWTHKASGLDENKIILYAVAGNPKGDIWAAGDSATLVHFTGGTWTAVPLTAAEGNNDDMFPTRFRAAWVSPAGDLWLGGENLHQLVHRKLNGAGGFGREDTMLSTGSTINDITAQGEEIWVVGYDYQYGSTVVHGLPGKIRPDVPESRRNSFLGLTFADQIPWVVGVGGSILYKDGNNWNHQNQDARLWNTFVVGGLSGNAPWTAGYYNQSGLWQWRGAAWELNSSSGTAQVIGSGLDELWLADGQLRMRLQQGNWVRDSTSLGADAMDLDIKGVFVSEGRVWLLSNRASKSALLTRAMGDMGSPWSTVDKSTTAIWQGLTGAGGGLWVVSNQGTILRYDQPAQSGSGVMETVLLANLKLNAIWARDPGHVWAVGVSGDDYQGIVLMRDKSGTWQRENLPNVPVPTEFYAIFGTATETWACGEYGILYHHDGQNWIRMDSGTNKDLHAVWADGQGNVWVGGESALLHLSKKL